MSFDKDDIAGKQTLDKTDSNNQNNSTGKKFGLNSDRPRFDFGSYSKYDQKEHDVNEMIAAFRKNLSAGKGHFSEETSFTAGKAGVKAETVTPKATVPDVSADVAGEQKPAAEVKKAEREYKPETEATKTETKAEPVLPQQKEAPVPPAKPEEKTAPKAPIPKVLTPQVKPEEKPVPKAPVPPVKPAEKPAPKAPVPPVKPAEKPAPKAPVPPAKPEEKPVPKAPIPKVLTPQVKPEEKPAPKAPVPPAKPTSGTDQKLPVVDSAAKKKVEEVKKRAEEAAKKGATAGTGIRDAEKKITPADAAAREKVEAVKKKAEEAAKKRAEAAKAQTVDKKSAVRVPEKAVKDVAKTESAQNAKAKAKAEKLKEKQLKAERKKAEKAAKKAEKEARIAEKEAQKAEKAAQKQEKKKVAGLTKDAAADNKPAEKTADLADKIQKTGKTVGEAASTPETEKQDSIKTAEEKASVVTAPLKGKIPEKPAKELTEKTGKALQKESAAVKQDEIPDTAEKQSKKKKIIILLFALILAAALAIAGGICYHNKKVEEQNLKAAKQRVELFFSTLKKGNIEKASEYTEGDMETNLKFLSNMSETFDKQLDSGFGKQVSKKSRDKIKVKYKDFLSDLYKSWLVDYKFKGDAKKAEDTDNTYTVKVDATFNDLSAITSTSMSKKVNKLLQDYEKKHDMNKLKALYSKKGEKTVTEKIVTDVFDDYFKYLKKELKKAPQNESVVTATVKKTSDDSWIITKITDAKTNGTSGSSASSGEKSA